MKIWKLSPIDLDFAGWCYSCFKGDAIVRAENEKEARKIAALNLGNFTKKTSGSQETPSSPWDKTNVVKCSELSNSNYSTDGQAELLETMDSDM